MTKINFRPHQIEGAAFLKGRRFALLADEMGVGKTAQVILAAKAMQRILIVCPATAKLNWKREFIKFSGRDAFVVGQKKQPTSNIVITNYHQVVNKLSKYRSIEWDVVIFDESHFVKEPTANRTHALFGKNGLIHKCKQIWCLSGTPAPNHAGELWVLLYTFGYTELSYEGFVNRYCTTAHVRRKYAALSITGTNTATSHEIKPLLKQFSLRRMLSDVAKDVPPMSFNTVAVETSYDPLKDFPEMKEKLQEEWKILRSKIDMDDMAVSDEKLLDTMTVLAPSISSLRRYHGLKKVPVCTEIIEQELTDNAYEKIIIFAIHTDVINMIVKKLKKFKPAIINGKVSEKKRDKAIQDFQHNPECRVFVGNILSAGTAINLDAANQVAFIESDWVPGNNQQAAGRARRLTQTLPVVCRFFSLPGFDDRLASALARKTQEISTFIV